MTEQPTNPGDLLDERLDRALASYTPALPPPGFDQRLRQRLLAADAPARSFTPRRQPWFWLAGAALAAAALLAGILIRPHPVSNPHQITASLPQNPLNLPQLAHKPGASMHTVRPLPVRIHAHALPAPIPHNDQLRLIAQLLANGPEAIASLAQAAERDNQPLDIRPLADAPIVIEPVRIDPIDDAPAKRGGAS